MADTDTYRRPPIMRPLAKEDYDPNDESWKGEHLLKNIKRVTGRETGGLVKGATRTYGGKKCPA